MKDFFKNKKKAIISIGCVAILIAIIIVIAIFATTSFAENASIGKQNAENFAFVDAGVDPAEVEKLKTEFEFKNGQFVYEIEFESNGTEYDYWVKASNGSIVKKEVDSTTEIANQKEKENENETKQENQKNSDKGNNNYTTNTNNNTEKQTDKTKDNSKKTNDNSNTSTDIITLDAAKNKALSDAKVSSSKATFTKNKLDYDDGIETYDIEFYTSTEKYEYEINAKNGAIINKEIEIIKNKASTNNNTAEDNNSSYIGIDKAKSVALNHAGVSNVTFKKAKLDRDDGKAVYEIEFYKDSMEYEYEINATTGKIIDYDVDND